MVLKLYWVHIKYSEPLKRAFLIQIVTKFKSYSKKGRAKLSRPLLMGSILENGLKANFRSYSISRAFQNRIFHFFADFSAAKWGKWGKLSKKSKIFKFDGFEATLRSKANVVNLVKCFWSNLFWRNLPRKWFWSYLELKNECYESLKTTFFSFLQVFEWRNWNHFLGKWGKAFKTS